MELLHTPEEIARLFNAAHAAEGVLLIITGSVTGAMQAS